MIDIHCHLTYPGLDEIKEKVVEEAKKVMDAVVTCGYPEDCSKALELTKKHEGFIFLTLGIHPIQIVKMTEKEIEEYKRFIVENRDTMIGLGEIGLDNHWITEKEEKDKCRKVFIDFLDLSKELELPVIFHTRKAEQECFDIVVNHDIKQAIFHCYSGNMTLAKQILEQGYYISLATNITNSKNTKKIAKSFPLNRLFTETDSPFLSPIPHKPNVPQNIRFVLEKMSDLRDSSVEDIDKQIMNNTKRVFGIF